MDTAITFPKDFQNILVVGLVEDLLGISGYGLVGMVVLG